ncbi:MAG: hypothetical protein EXS35_09990 [Pedosphaera sp.]|nr:hypothetical protein [Pedosphaera sp.]
MTSAPPRDLPPIAPWLWLCAWLNATGWILSSFHALNRTGYACSFAVGMALAFLFRKQLGLVELCCFNFCKQRCRFRRFLPAGFAIVAGLAILGGVLHPPSNYDALAYRLPRILHWQAAGQWEWIHTSFQRLNTRAAGYEWVASPMMLFTHSDRLLFLIGVVSQLLLPGLVFSTYTRLGVSRVAAWHWMWVLPTGYSFVLQAGGIGNDIYGAVFALASVDFALRARESGRFRDVALSFLAVALLSGAKTSNLPLMLPWGLAVLPSLKLLLQRPVLTLMVAAMTGFASLLPICWANHHYSGDWTGAKAEAPRMTSGDPRVTIPGNTLNAFVQNFAPPIFPMASKWNEAAPHLLPKTFHEKLLNTFEPGGANLALAELQNEEACGLGFGVSFLLIVSVAAAWTHRKMAKISTGGTARIIRWSPYFSFLVYAANSGVSTVARIITPYYLLLIPLLLTGLGHVEVCRRKWWRASAGLVYALAALLIILTPSRPLWPANTILGALARSRPDNAKIARAQTVFSVYGERSEAMSPLRNILPAGEKIFGLITRDDPETSLWRPFGARRFLHVLPQDSADEIRARDIKYIMVNSEVVEGLGAGSFESWLGRVRGEVVQKIPLRYRAGRGPFDWYVVRLSVEPARKP